MAHKGPLTEQQKAARKAYLDAYWSARPERRKEIKRNSYHKNKAKNAERDKKKRNTPEFREKHNALARNRRKEDINDRILHCLRTRLNTCVRSAKSGATIDLLGCSVSELRAHLGSQFTEGMSWENHGTHGWHIDHIIPCSLFSDLTDPEQQKECFHYMNLQPLWAFDNLSKGGKRE